MKLSARSIRTKLLYGFGATIVVGIVQASFALSYYQEQAQHERLATRTHEILELGYQAQQDIVAMEASYRGFLITGEDRFLEPYFAYESRQLDDLNKLIGLSSEAEQRQLWQSIKKYVEQWQSEVTRPGIALRRSNPGGVVAWVKGATGKENTDNINATFAVALERQLKLLEERTAANTKSRAILPWIMGGGAALNALISVLVAFLLANRITRRLRSLRTHARQVGEGKFSLGKIRATGTDEIAQLSGAINEMVETLSTIDAQARAIAAGRFDDAVFSREVPGEIGQTYSEMVANLRTATVALEKLGEGELTVEIHSRGQDDLLGNATAQLVQSLRDKDEALKQRDSEREELMQNQLFESRLERALDMAQGEDDVLGVFKAVMQAKAPDVPVEVLIADNSQAHLERVVFTQDSMPGCGVSTPSECNAVRQARTQLFESSEEFDACPYLYKRNANALSAVCTPLNVMGQAVGVVHAVSNELSLLKAPSAVHDLELVTARAGERLSVVRAFARSEAQAALDPLTGLLNRRSIGDGVRAITSSGKPYSVAYGDLDHFKALNDTHGHETGDQALRLFSKVLRKVTRPGDLVGRWGGEEFIIILADTTPSVGAKVLDRIRNVLREELKSGKSPSFTVSFGIAQSQVDQTFDSVVARADEGLLRAKQAGRDRVEIMDDAKPSTLALEASNDTAELTDSQHSEQNDTEAQQAVTSRQSQPVLIKAN